ncbi:MAG: hypothetical protein IKD28_04275 [Clostridia bacterium]|nr:hypothetical protein [Clostridia bacterium]
MKIKKIALLLALFALAALTVIGLASCKDPEPACEHTSFEWVLHSPASCTTEGAKHKICLLCEEVLETAVIGEIAHTEEKIPGRAPTCLVPGLTDGKKCSVCNEVLLAQVEIPTHAHVEELVPAVKPTCTQAGRTAGKVCKLCDTVLLACTPLPPTHTESDWIIDEIATVGTPGSKHTECLVCHAPMKTEAIPATEDGHEHAAESWIVETPATCTQTGVKIHVCACGLVMDIDDIAVAAHTEQILPAIAPSCMTQGQTQGKICAVCDAVLVPQTTIAQADHTEITVLGTTPTCTANGLTDGKKCAVCTVETVSQRTLYAKGHTFTAGVCRTCGKAEPYGVWIVDGLGRPITDIVVKVMKGKEQVKMYPYMGVFLEFDIPKDNYTIELDLSRLDKNYTYDLALCKLTPADKATTIRLFDQPETSTELFVGAPISKNYEAHYIGEGSYKVALTPNDYTFFVFTPSAPAIYTVTYESGAALRVGYHGSTFFVQGIDLSPDSSDINGFENGLSVNVYSSNLGSTYVFSVYSSSEKSCVLNIENAGDPGTRLSDQPWTPYLENNAKVTEQLNFPASGTYTAIDLSDLTLKAVYNENDGYYHLNSADGPVIFIDLTNDTDFVEGMTIQVIGVNQRIGRYIYDINGDVVEKRSYNELFAQYGIGVTEDTMTKDTVRVPLTKKLAEAIQVLGEKQSWWAAGSDANIFTPVLGNSYNQEFAWLLFCGYYQ